MYKKNLTSKQLKHLGSLMTDQSGCSESEEQSFWPSNPWRNPQRDWMLVNQTNRQKENRCLWHVLLAPNAQCILDREKNQFINYLTDLNKETTTYSCSREYSQVYDHIHRKRWIGKTDGGGRSRKKKVVGDRQPGIPIWPRNSSATLPQSIKMARPTETGSSRDFTKLWCLQTSYRLGRIWRKIRFYGPEQECGQAQFIYFTNFKFLKNLNLEELWYDNKQKVSICPKIWLTIKME